MPYFSFSLNENIKINSSKTSEHKIYNLNSDITYFSKNTFLWKKFTNQKNQSYLKFVKFEKRYPIKKMGSKILFFLPPSIGLGDAVEYALSIKEVLNSNRFKKIGIAFVGNYREIFEKYFNLKNIYNDIISQEEMHLYDTIFHVTIEINELRYQKYDRKNIEHLISTYFSVPKFRKEYLPKSQEIKKISIFPISKSPLRSMYPDLLNHIIDNFYKKIEIEIILDNKSEISSYVKNNIISKQINTVHPKNLHELLLTIENINFGIFMDSGPLHVAKILNKKGILIISTVGEHTLLDKFQSIEVIYNNYESFYCKSPCGLVNVFNYNDGIGCYDSLNVQKKTIIKLKNLQKLQRNIHQKDLVKLISNPVNCLKKVNKKKIINKIQKNIFN